MVEIFGIPADCAEERTKTVRNDSFNPNFDESFQFEVCIPEIALVRFLVLDDDYIGDDFIGQYTIPFECLQSGEWLTGVCGMCLGRNSRVFHVKSS